MRVFYSLVAVPHSNTVSVLKGTQRPTLSQGRSPTGETLDPQTAC